MFLKYFLCPVYLVVFVTNYISAPLPWCRTDPYPPLSSTRASRHLSTSSSIPRHTHTVTPDLEMYLLITPTYYQRLMKKVRAFHLIIDKASA